MVAPLSPDPNQPLQNLEDLGFQLLPTEDSEIASSSTTQNAAPQQPTGWFFTRWRAPKAASSAPASSSSSSTASHPGLLNRLFTWWRPSSLPFDEGIILKDTVSADTIAKTIFVPKMHITMRITDQNNTPNTMMIDGKPVRWSKQFERDIPRMLRTGQLFIKDKQVADMSHLSDLEKGEEIVRRIYKLTGKNEEMTYRITSLMCQNTPLFLYHSASRQMEMKHHMILVQGTEKTTDRYNLKKTVGFNPTQPNINLQVTMDGVLGMGFVERQYHPTLQIQDPATLKAKEEINLTTGTAQYSYKVSLTSDALAQMYPDPLLRTQSVLKMCMENIALDEEGIFGVSSSATELDRFTQLYQHDMHFDYLKDYYQDFPQNSLFAADLMKRTIRSAEIIPEEQRGAFFALAQELSSLQEGDTASMIERLKSLIEQLPPLRQEILKDIFTFFAAVTSHNDKNLMTAENISTMLSSNLFPSTNPNPSAIADEITALNALGLFLLSHHLEIFPTPIPPPTQAIEQQAVGPLASTLPTKSKSRKKQRIHSHPSHRSKHSRKPSKRERIRKSYHQKTSSH